MWIWLFMGIPDSQAQTLVCPITNYVHPLKPDPAATLVSQKLLSICYTSSVLPQPYMCMLEDVRSRHPSEAPTRAGMVTDTKLKNL